jgi:hypothetical protein
LVARILALPERVGQTIFELLVLGQFSQLGHDDLGHTFRPILEEGGVAEYVDQFYPESATRWEVDYVACSSTFDDSANGALISVAGIASTSSILKSIASLCLSYILMTGWVPLRSPRSGDRFYETESIKCIKLCPLPSKSKDR